MDSRAQSGLLGAAEGSCNSGHSASPRSPAANPMAGKMWNADAGPALSNEDQKSNRHLGENELVECLAVQLLGNLQHWGLDVRNQACMG